VRRYFFVSMPKPLSFIVTVIIATIIMLAVAGFISDKAMPVGTGGEKANATLEDIAERLYEDMERR